LTISAIEYARALQNRLEQYTNVERLLHQADIILTPGAPSSAPYGLASTGSPVMQGPWTVMGVPTLSLPTGLSKDDLPLAVQLVGSPFAEDYLLTAARWCESVLDVQLRPHLIQ